MPPKALITNALLIALWLLAPAATARTVGTDTLRLPFFDDFAQMRPHPSPALWEPSGGVLTNLRYALNLKTIGTATFDAASASGPLYPQLRTTPQLADTLTSRPINLALRPADSLYLSFCIQPQGLGYAPSERDSLVLELLDSAGYWHRAWAASVDVAAQTLTQRTYQRTHTHSTNKLCSRFHTVMLPITDTIFMHKAFRFRFMNYASLDKHQSTPSQQGNCDHWMLDLVHLNAHRHAADTALNDVAFSQPIAPIMLGYTAVPWSHVNAETKRILFPHPMQLTTTYANLGDSVWNVTRHYQIIDLSGHTSTVQSFSGGSENSEPWAVDTFTRNFEYNDDFPSAWADSAKFRFVAYLSTDNDPRTAHLRHNDTLRADLCLHNYYAYDDGTAESGWGMSGIGTSRAMAAMRFSCLKADTLQGVMMYFNRTPNNANATSFTLTVWDDDHGQPGRIIAQRTGVRTTYADSLNRFVSYSIPPTFIAKGSTFYVGWQQVYDRFMHVGVDLNTQHNDKLLYNMGSGWQPVGWSGTLMLRPIMGSTHTPTGIARPQPKPQHQLRLHPNPASTIVHIATEGQSLPTTLELYSPTGALVLSLRNAQQISVEHLQPGLYILRARFADGQQATSKLIISR